MSVRHLGTARAAVSGRLHADEHELLCERAAEWGITATEYARLQASAPAGDWGIRRAVVTLDVLRAPADYVDLEVSEIMAAEGYALCPNGCASMGSLAAAARDHVTRARRHFGCSESALAAAASRAPAHREPVAGFPLSDPAQSRPPALDAVSR